MFFFLWSAHTEDQAAKSNEMYFSFCGVYKLTPPCGQILLLKVKCSPYKCLVFVRIKTELRLKLLKCLIINMLVINKLKYFYKQK